MNSSAPTGDGRLPAWWSFVKTLGPDEQYERHDDLPAEAKVKRTRACWSKDGQGAHLFVDLDMSDGVVRWRVYMPKKHESFARIVAGEGLVSIGCDDRGIKVKVGGRQG